MQTAKSMSMFYEKISSNPTTLIAGAAPYWSGPRGFSLFIVLPGNDFTVHRGRNADHFCKNFCKINGIVDPYHRGNLRDRMIGRGKQQLRLLDAHKRKVSHRTDVKQFFKLVQKIAFVHVGDFSQVV